MDVAAPRIPVSPFAADQLYRSTDLSHFEFSTTAELQPIDGLVGQTQARDAIRFGTHTGKGGVNLFVIGPSGARMQEAVKAVLAEEARSRPSPSGWVYVNNFADPELPIAIELPAGRARKFQDTMHKLIDDFKSAVPAVFQSEDHQTRRGAIDEAFQKRQARRFRLYAIRPREKISLSCGRRLDLRSRRRKTDRWFLPTNSTRGPKLSAARFKLLLRPWKRTLNTSFTRFRKWRSEGATKHANSIGKLRSTRSVI